MVIHTSTVVFTLLATFAWIAVPYEGYAEFKGWTTSEMFRSTTSFVRIAGVIALPGAALSAGYLSVWWSAIVVLVTGLFLAVLITNIFKSLVQPIAAVGLGVFWILGILILSNP